jgi:general secretion pathway protein K
VNGRQDGAAIVYAMAVVALATIAATAMSVAHGTWVRHQELSVGHAQARALIHSGLDWACSLLADDRRAGNVDHLGEPWALRVPPVVVEGGNLAGQLDDQQGAFNLNNLVSSGKVVPAQLAHFSRLLTTLRLPTALADSLADWLDADGEPRSQSGAEDSHYLALNPPYRAANRPLADVSELALVRGYDDSVRARLRPFVTALPQRTAVNVNTARPEVIAAVIDGLAIDDARALTAYRDKTYFRDRAEFAARLPRGLGASPDDITVSSDYFLASLRVEFGEAAATGAALISRARAGWPAVVWRKYL